MKHIIKQTRVPLFGIIVTAVLLTALVGCVSAPKHQAGPMAVPEIHAGILAGYLQPEECPNSLELVPQPPAKGSVAFARDEEASKESFAFRGTERWNQAIKDADLSFPAAAGAFTDAIGFQISENETPFLYQLMRRTLADAGLSTYTAKNHYQRQRPFMTNGQPIGTPDDEEALRNDGSYPSGHTAIGWAWALILTEVVPKKTDAILKRGYEFGQSRIICNVHWQSDVDMGRIMGAAAVARLHSNATFMADLVQAKAEAQTMATP